jgi:hypothetical protein
VNTEASEVQPGLFTNVTTISPKYVLCNLTSREIIVAQFGQGNEKLAEVIPHKARLPLSWLDLKSGQNCPGIMVKLVKTGQEEQASEVTARWSKKITPKIGRISMSIPCGNDDEHVLISK